MACICHYLLSRHNSECLEQELSFLEEEWYSTPYAAALDRFISQSNALACSTTCSIRTNPRLVAPCIAGVRYRGPYLTCKCYLRTLFLRKQLVPVGFLRRVLERFPGFVFASPLFRLGYVFSMSSISFPAFVRSSVKVHDRLPGQVWSRFNCSLYGGDTSALGLPISDPTLFFGLAVPVAKWNCYHSPISSCSEVH
jgi:hypothetical protein